MLKGLLQKRLLFAAVMPCAPIPVVLMTLRAFHAAVPAHLLPSVVLLSLAFLKATHGKEFLQSGRPRVRIALFASVGLVCLYAVAALLEVIAPSMAVFLRVNLCTVLALLTMSVPVCLPYLGLTNTTRADFYILGVSGFERNLTKLWLQVLALVDAFKCSFYNINIKAVAKAAAQPSAPLSSATATAAAKSAAAPSDASSPRSSSTLLPHPPTAALAPQALSLIPTLGLLLLHTFAFPISLLIFLSPHRNLPANVKLLLCSAAFTGVVVAQHLSLRHYQVSLEMTWDLKGARGADWKRTAFAALQGLAREVKEMSEALVQQVRNAAPIVSSSSIHFNAVQPHLQHAITRPNIN